MVEWLVSEERDSQRLLCSVLNGRTGSRLGPNWEEPHSAAHALLHPWPLCLIMEMRKITQKIILHLIQEQN